MNKKEKKEAIPFITINTDHKAGKDKVNFVLNPKALELFTSPQLRNKKLAVVAIAGPQRTGKSFLANRLLKQMDGFAVGPSTMPCTKGIWIWSEPVKITEDTSLIIIDTEGLNSVQRDINVDVKIFALSVLLSSVFVYNSLGHIDEKALENISLVLNLTNNICVRRDSKNDEAEIGEFFPHFYWVLRDFSLDLKGKSERDYLEQQLAPVSQDEKDPKNVVRGKIKKFFTFRRCECFVRPLIDESKLAHIEETKYDELRPEFRQKLETFLGSFFNNLPIKTIRGKPLNGEMFANLTMEYLNAINEGGIPQILTSLERVISSESRKVMEELQAKYQLTMADLTKESKLPVDDVELEEHHKHCVGILVSKFDERLKNLLDEGQYRDLRKELQALIEKEYSAKVRLNQEKSEAKCKELWDRFIKGFKMLEIDSMDSITASLVREKQEEFRKSIREFLQQAKAPRKYSFFVQKVPSFLFDYFDRVTEKVKKVYVEEITKIKISTKQAQEQVDRVKKTMKEQEKLVMDKQREIDEIKHEKDIYKQKATELEMIHGAYEESNTLATTDLERNLESRKKKNAQLKTEMIELNESLTKCKAELVQKKVEIVALQRKVRELERDGQPMETEETVGEIMTTLSDVKLKLGQMDEFFKKRLQETNPQQRRIKEIEELRNEKLQATERANDTIRQKKEEFRRSMEEMRQKYEKSIESLTRHIQNIQLENMQLKKRSADFPTNEQKMRGLMSERKKFEDAIELKQNNLTIQSNLNVEKDRKIQVLENQLNNFKYEFAMKSGENAKLNLFKDSMGFIMKESLSWVLGKPNQLKHSVQTLDGEDLQIVKGAFNQLGLKPF